ncbi:glycosyltransferase family 4 protein [Peribacillus frigoritolerans]|uniref:glycosyltransferase family 4 protein n=1 Tax=Peribacillus frigoritolerans TaxID=450367 RepID=UPI0035171947
MDFSKGMKKEKGENMKVIMIGSHLRTTGGITRVVKNYLQSDLDKKVNLEYFPTYFGSNHLINILYFFIRFIVLYFKLNISNVKYDVAHIHMSYKGSFYRKKIIINSLKKKNIPILLHMHGSQFKDFYNQSSKKQQKEITNTLNKVDIILALGKEWKDYYQSICKSQVFSLDNAVFLKETSNDEEKIYITTMGVLSNRKGTYDLITAAAKLKGNIDSKYKFLLAGDGEVENVKKRINDLKLNDLFIVPGWISNEEKVQEIYRKSVIYVLPSYNEGMPMSILEAMSFGLPIVSTNVGSIPSVIKNEENGILIKPGDIQDLKNAIEQILNNQQMKESMGKNNINKIKVHYNIYESIEKLVKIYSNLSKQVH